MQASSRPSVTRVGIVTYSFLAALGTLAPMPWEGRAWVPSSKKSDLNERYRSSRPLPNAIIALNSESFMHHTMPVWSKQLANRKHSDPTLTNENRHKNMPLRNVEVGANERRTCQKMEAPGVCMRSILSDCERARVSQRAGQKRPRREQAGTAHGQPSIGCIATNAAQPRLNLANQ